MPRLIDADMLKQVIEDNVYLVQDAFNSRDYGMFWTGGIEKAIDDAPTVDAVPLQDYKSMEQTVNKLTKAIADAEPVKRGRWIKLEDDYNNHLYECSYCHTWTSLPTEEDNDPHIRYCWSCGAKMGR